LAISSVKRKQKEEGMYGKTAVSFLSFLHTPFLNGLQVCFCHFKTNSVDVLSHIPQSNSGTIS